ncbi:hypothetical protein EVAR_98128_1 [Eumeta japonica]|uniref:Uncharacterized protein n=1 Tax=Eumeta variegata TaxID=151549 RepID=A0A4C2AFY9_EUMVA|nr:hypothetical protein EVAR_98128_1 [Eumeta japonica]
MLAAAVSPGVVVSLIGRPIDIEMPSARDSPTGVCLDYLGIGSPRGFDAGQYLWVTPVCGFLFNDVLDMFSEKKSPFMLFPVGKWAKNELELKNTSRTTRPTVSYAPSALFLRPCNCHGNLPKLIASTSSCVHFTLSGKKYNNIVRYGHVRAGGGTTRV